MIILDKYKFLVLSVACFLVGCSTTKPYTQAPEKNIFISTKTESGSVFSSVGAALDVYRLDETCTPKYQGTVALKEDRQAIGMPVNQLSYLVVGFSSSSFLGGTSNNISQSTLLTPLRGFHYKMNVSYIDNIYDVSITEVNKKTRKHRLIDEADQVTPACTQVL